jgi:hypothetical protein
MTITIPISVEGSTKECRIQLRDMTYHEVVAEIFHGTCEPGLQQIEFDTENLHGKVDAGIYIMQVTVGEDTITYPVQYMPP